MRTEYKGLRDACWFLGAVRPDDGDGGAEYERRRSALYRLNFSFGCKTVLEACQKGHQQAYIDLVRDWK